ncbi:hypothetical protein [Lysobacter capsici]|uniref:hypothetical protein n=1 Tax=Lysobacter capsici TaxID=435897 RepID=UPI0006276AAB|nr:hypothetical protein [Lysobacter capsici]
MREPNHIGGVFARACWRGRSGTGQGDRSMRITLHTACFVAAFVFAAGFSSMASAQPDPDCIACVTDYEQCVLQPDAVAVLCEKRYERCMRLHHCSVLGD